jgi:hypothetical protein
VSRPRLPGLALRQLRSRPTLAIAQWLTLVAAVTLVASVVVIQQQATDQGLQASLSGAQQGADLVVERDGVSQQGAYDAYQRDTAARVSRELRDVLIPAAQYARSSALQLSSIDGTAQGNPPSQVSSVTSYTGLRDHVHVVSGLWPADTRVGADWLLTASARATDTLGTPLNLHVGSEYCFTYFVPASRRHAPEVWCGRMAAVWLPNDPADPYWAGHVPETDVVTGHDSFFQLFGQIPDAVGSAVQQWVPDPARVTSSNAAAIVDAVTRLRGAVSVSSNDTFVSGLDSTISGFLDRQAGASGPTLVSSIGLAFVALAAMGFASLQFLLGHAGQAALWRARGWPRQRVLGLFSMEFALLAAAAVPPALIATALIAVGVSAGGAAHPTFGWSSLARAAPPVLIAAAAFLAVLLVLAAARSDAELAQQRDVRPARAGRGWVRRHADLAMAAAGAALLWFVHGAGPVEAAPGDQGSWPGLALPILGAALLAPASLRLVALAARLLPAARSLGSRLARWQLERDPAQYGRLCLLVTLAVAVGAFASTYSASDRANAVDRADYQVGSNVRATFSAAASPPQLGELAASLPRGTPAAQVFRGLGRPGRSGNDATILGIPGLDLTDVAMSRPDFASKPLPALAGEMAAADPDGLVVAGTPRSLSVSVYSSGLDGRVVIEVSDSNGRQRSIPAGGLGTAGWSVATATLEGLDPALSFPIRVRAVRIEATGVRGTGDVALANLRTSAGAMVESFATADGWWQESFAPNPAEGDVVPSATHPAGTQPTIDIPVDHQTVILQPRPASAPLPVLLASQTMAALGLSQGQAFPLHINTVDVQLLPIASFDEFPTYYPARESLVVAPLASLLGRMAHAGGFIPWANELWIGGSGDTRAITDRLSADLDLRQTLLRSDAETRALTDPLRVGLRDELTLGFIVALAIVVIGFALHFLAAARSRATQFAIMRASGLPEAEVRASMLAEQVVVLLSGLLAGTVIGLALAWAAVPLFHLGSLPEDLTPPAALHLDLVTLLGTVAGTGALTLVIGRVVAGAGARVDIMGTVRSLS